MHRSSVLMLTLMRRLSVSGDCYQLICVPFAASTTSERLLCRMHPAHLWIHHHAGKALEIHVHQDPLSLYLCSCTTVATAFVTCWWSQPLQIVWYRQGDLEPKFRNLIYYMLVSIVLLCLCANLYFHDVR